ncbi:RNA polymerase-associated protein RapA [Verrucomicrobium sp. BvORR034]|uniref:RNA polymerase-associated protein RapA n=1 Tax=Verrucomicrobium sp. BvORR034 TaxID=1396418 RepID=UPI000679CAFC|nr:RNA polymerase-associated protein RapA [Verrucomicrobium sp. BvORR034]
MSMDLPVSGQRWVSDTEPELGLGIILKASFGRLEVLFPAAAETRQYALKSAPLRRVRFAEGDVVQSHAGEDFTVVSVEEANGLLVYKTDKRDLPEAELSDSISFSKPEDRLTAGQVDELGSYDLRIKGLQHRSRMRQSPVRGYVGGRVDLIPHQMFIAGEVGGRLVPRVLLADEVGLGKTIEALLILHRLHLTGRAGRILILVPEALVHQWFVELLRRFHLLFHIFDEARCESLESHDESANPFLESQLVICSLGFLSSDENRSQQALEAGWDLVVVDEAHHLEWTPQAASPQYTLVESLGAKCPGLLLLTATPQQLGPEGHFARLRLLDPNRYQSLEKFLQEAEHYEVVAQAVDRLQSGQPLSKTDVKLFGGQSERVKKHCEALAGGDEEARPLLITELLDEFGTGRVMFRNTRAALKGFPLREAALYKLTVKASTAQDDSEDDSTTEDASDLGLIAKVKWLAAKLKELDPAKVLLICKTKDLVEEIHTLLIHELNVNVALFHEGLSMLQRDRNAAYFAEEDGARVLICSEIGSEGRNFQFAHHLVLFDLPENPELLEQRIGRLDRIGQTDTIHIHVPYIAGTQAEVLARWYQDGLDAFQNILHGANEVRAAVAADLNPLLESFNAKKLTSLITKSKKQRTLITKKLEKGHDRLLELSSCRIPQATAIIEQIQELDTDREFEEFFIRMMDHFGLQVEELTHRTYLISPGQNVDVALPGLPEEGLSITFDRSRALTHENTAFMSQDHPLVRGALDQLLGKETGNSAFGIWKGSGNEGLLLETCYILECTAPASLHADRFLPATPVLVTVDHAQADRTGDHGIRPARLDRGDIAKLLDRGVVKKKVLPSMLSTSKKLAATQMEKLTASAVEAMEAQLQSEIDRLEDLQKINDHVRPEEVEALRKEKDELTKAIAGATLRLDGLRLVWKMG